MGRLVDNHKQFTTRIMINMNSLQSVTIGATLSTAATATPQTEDGEAGMGEGSLITRPCGLVTLERIYQSVLSKPTDIET